MKPLLELLRLGLVGLGIFLLGCVLVVLGIAAYLWLATPPRLAVRVVPGTEAVVIIDPQLLQVSLTETNVRIIDPPIEAFLSGAATNAAIWVDGKAFKSGGRAGWEVIKGACGLWLLSAGTLICGLLLKRTASARKTTSESGISISEPAAAPNPSSAQPSDSSRTREGAAGELTH